MRWLRWVPLALVVLAVGVFAFLMQRLLYTQQGLEFALAQLQRVPSARIEVRGARGAIAGKLAFDRVVVDHAAVRVEADDVSGTPAIFGLLAGRLTVSDASIGRVEVVIKDRGPQPESQTHFLPARLSIVAPDAVVSVRAPGSSDAAGSPSTSSTRCSACHPAGRRVRSSAVRFPERKSFDSGGRS